MPILSRSEIRERMKREVDNPTSLVITPLLEEDDALDSDSINLRLGSYFLLPRFFQQPFFCPDSKSSSFLQVSVHVPLGDYLVVPAHQTVLGATLEFIKLPRNVSGQILTKSSVARTFIVIETAPWIHPGYRGCLTLEIANVSNTPLLLYPGRFMAQLVLMDVSPEEPAADERFNPKYLGPVYPEAPSFRDPKDDLAAIGIPETWVIPEREPGGQRGTRSSPTNR
jgi:dCTP deaminase